MTSSIAENKGGTFSLMGYMGRDTLKLQDGIEVRGGKGGDKSKEWRTPGEAQLSVESDNVSFHTNGRAAFDSKFDWLPVLQWTPREAGAYRVMGTLDLYTGQKSAKPDTPDAVAWAVLKITEDGTAQVVAQKRYADKAKVALTEQAELQAIKLEKGESLAITVWRPTWHWGAGGTLKGLEITRAG